MNELTNKSILLTGGAGFIGSHIAEYLLNNFNIKFLRILDNLSTGKMNNIELLLSKFENVEFMYGDISNLEVCRKAVMNIDIICHQAALGSVPRSVDDPLSSHNSNVIGFFNILIAAKDYGIKRVVYASSSSVYGDNNELPKVESKIGNPISPYAATKLIDEIYGYIFTNTYGMECIGLRYFNVFGPRQNPNGEYAAVIPKFITLIKSNQSPIINGDGSFSRDFTYIDNIVNANILALTTHNKNAFGKSLNIGNGGQITILNIYNQIKEYMNQHDNEPIFQEVRKGDVPHTNADISLANSILNYSPTITFQEGLKRTIRYYTPFLLL